jgi:hypothetical protein
MPIHASLCELDFGFGPRRSEFGLPIQENNNGRAAGFFRDRVHDEGLAVVRDHVLLPEIVSTQVRCEQDKRRTRWFDSLTV